MKISFVIPALNEEKYIGPAVDSIHHAMQQGDAAADYEIIVVDDDSADATADIAQRHGAEVLSVRRRNIAAVRNAGAQQAAGELLIFVDADTQVGKALVREAIAAMRGGAVWGTALAVPADQCPLWARLGLAAFNFYYVRLRQFGYGFFFFVRRDIFHQLVGFPTDTPEGEDMAFSKLLLRHHGRPRVLRQRVATSARKTRQFGFWYHLKMLWLSFRHGDAMYSHPDIADYRDGDLRVR